MLPAMVSKDNKFMSQWMANRYARQNTYYNNIMSRFSLVKRQRLPTRTAFRYFTDTSILWLLHRLFVNLRTIHNLDPTQDLPSSLLTSYIVRLAFHSRHANFSRYFHSCIFRVRNVVYVACFSWSRCLSCTECFFTWELHHYLVSRSVHIATCCQLLSFDR